jgi:hypothetical protein
MRTKLECDFSLPKKEVKEHIWKLLTDPAKARSMTLYDYSMISRVFLLPFIPYHFDLALPFASSFYIVAPNLVQRLDRSRAEAFLAGACPSVRGHE